jgi:hypothetical protein
MNSDTASYARQSARRRWVTVDQLAHEFSAFTPAAIRALIQRSRPHYDHRGEWVEGNGLASMICQPGGKHGKVMLDAIGFARWLENWVSGTAPSTADERATSSGMLAA